MIAQNPWDPKNTNFRQDLDGHHIRKESAGEVVRLVSSVRKFLLNLKIDAGQQTP